MAVQVRATYDFGTGAQCVTKVRSFKQAFEVAAVELQFHKAVQVEIEHRKGMVYAATYAGPDFPRIRPIDN